MTSLFFFFRLSLLSLFYDVRLGCWMYCVFFCLSISIVFIVGFDTADSLSTIVVGAVVLWCCLPLAPLCYFLSRIVLCLRMTVL